MINKLKSLHRCQHAILSILALSFMLFLVFPVAQGQDLYDFDHSKLYARHLMRSKKFDLAADEYQRLVFTAPKNDTFRIQLLKAYRLGHNGAPGISQWQLWRLNNDVLSQAVNEEYAKILLTSGKESDAIIFAATPENLSFPANSQIALYGYALLQDWENTDKVINTWPSSAPLPYRNALTQLSASGKKIPHKSPAIAAALSAIVPGAGKAYTKNWADGAIGLVFVGLNTWQAWRRFDREGSDSIWGWFHGGLAAGFYIGNIYGSHKAARIFNQYQKHLIRHEAERIIFPALD